MAPPHTQKRPPKVEYRFKGYFSNHGIINPRSSLCTAKTPEVLSTVLLTDLPNEIILLIGEALRPKELYKFILTSRRFASLLIDRLHKLACRSRRFSTTALFYAAAFGNEELVRLLLEKGTGIKILEYMETESRYEIIHETPDECYEELFVFVLEQAENLVLMYDNEQYTALRWAIVNKDKALTRILFEKGADIVFKTYPHYGTGPLHAAVIRCEFTMVYFLLDNDFPVDALDSDGLTALQVGVRYQPENIRGRAMIMLLLDRGASVLLKDKFQKTVLHKIATLGGWSGVVMKILKLGADVNARDSTGSTALHEAARLGHFNTVNELLKAGADVTLKSDYGDTPLQLAKVFQKDAVASVLSKHLDLNQVAVVVEKDNED